MAGHRCGWCITGDHAGCVVVLEMGTKAEIGSGIKRGIPRFWFCPCEAKGHPQDRCVDCHRTNTKMDNHRCVNRASCDQARMEKRVKRKVRPILVGEDADV